MITEQRPIQGEAASSADLWEEPCSLRNGRVVEGEWRRELKGTRWFRLSFGFETEARVLSRGVIMIIPLFTQQTFCRCLPEARPCVEQWGNS